MKKQSALFVTTLVMIGMCSLAIPIWVSACENGTFEHLNGPTAITFGERYTYSVYPRGKFESVNWSAAGGEVLKFWNDGHTYFADVRWTQPHPDKGTRLKVWGKDGCGTMRDARLPVNPGAKEDTGTGRDVSAAIGQFYDLFDAKGQHISTSEDRPSLTAKWDDRISSVWVAGDHEVILYEGPNYDGQSVVLQGGQSPKGRIHNLSDPFNNNVSSFRVMKGMISVVSPQAVSEQTLSECEEGTFETLSGPTAVRFGERYTYSVALKGKFKTGNWSAAGGEILKTWNEGSTHFADVRWTHVEEGKGTRLKVWGEDGCGIMRDARLPVNPNAQKETKNSGSGRGVPAAGQFYDLFDAKGEHISTSRDRPTLTSKWDNRISSVWVAANREVIIYEGPNYSGQAILLQGGTDPKGRIYNLSAPFNNNVSSFRIR